MVTFKYEKKENARFLSHLDVQSIIIRSIRRTGFLPSYSKGYNPHLILKMSPPIPLGLASIAEYFTIDISLEDKNVFQKLLNEKLPEGLVCVDNWETIKNPKLMGLALAAIYKVKGNFQELVKEWSFAECTPLLNSILKNNCIEFGKNFTNVILPLGQKNYRIDRFLQDIKADELLNISLKDVIKEELLLSSVSQKHKSIEADVYLSSLEKK